MKSIFKPIHHPAGADERGSALVLVLGVLALLLISATVFIFTANTEREAASVNADVTKARLIARGKMEAAAAIIYAKAQNKMYPGGIDVMNAGRNGVGWDDIYFRPSIDNVLPKTVYSNGLNEALHLNVGFDYTPATIESEFYSTISWHLLQYNPGDGVKIYGRGAYVFIDESGKLDINGALTDAEPYFDKNGNGSWDAGEFYIDINGNGSYDATAVPEGDEANSTGSSPQFINLQQLFTRYTWTGLLGGGDANAFRTRRQGTVNRWLSWRQMYAADYAGPLFVKPPNNTYLLQAKDTIFPRSYDKEAYSALDGTGARQDYSRFSFSRFDWDAYSPADTDGDGLYDLAGTVHRQIWDDTDTNYSASIPWLADMTATLDVDGNGTPGEASDNTALRNQVIANIIDYGDSDNIPTHDYAGAKTYCGLEKVPYINEAALSCSYVVDDLGDADATNDTGVLTVYGYVEMINMYGDGLSFNEEEIFLDVTATIDGVPTTYNFSAPAKAVAMPANSYHVVSMTPQTTNVPVPNATTCTVVIDSVNVVFKNGTTVYDFSVVSNTSTASFDLTDSTAAYASSETYDPRSNTVPTMWAWDGGGISGTALGSGTGSLGVFDSGTNTFTASLLANRNTFSYPDGSSPLGLTGYTTKGTHYDTEMATDPAAGISTAYIRNAPMQSLWELGAIHRGEPWRTINLLTYNENPATATYVNGDAILLDQCTIGWEKVAYGRLNMNSPLNRAWYPVLRTVNLGAGYDYANAGAVISDANINTLTNNIKTFTNILVNAVPYGQDSRGKIVAVTSLKNSTGGTQNTNATREEIIGRIAGLLTARSNYFTILATGQSVKDLGAVPDAIPAADRPSSWSELAAGKWVDVLAEAKVVAIVYRDAYTNEFKVEEIRYVE
ncbi:MAG: hypothetical protein RRC34_16765 [Lentisphaeria bacterium]|nr:hypothetical protein [Lentisphaeria bacterium]